MNIPVKSDADGGGESRPTAIEGEIAQELARLPSIERLRTNQDVEGKNMLAAAEPSKLVQLGLDAFKRRVRQLTSSSDRPLATQLQSSFARDQNLWLKMLRAENFDSELAAKRLVNFLTLTKEVLRTTSVARTDALRLLTLAHDFSQEERDHQNLGALQLLLFRDDAGRRVAGCFDVETSSIVRGSISESSLLKEAYYLFQAASEDETTQKEGLVFLFMVPSATSAVVDGSLTPILSRIFQCGPLRVAAIHVCAPDSEELQIATATFIRQFDTRDRVRARLHYGTSWEYTKSLKQFGIPTDWLPSTQPDGTVRNNYHRQWIAVQEAKENSNIEGIECPDTYDILLGRGQVLQYHRGNIALREDFIRERYSQFAKAASKQEKDAILNSILDELARKKRRFLKQKQDNIGLWYEISRSEARSKLVTSFREQKKSLERKPAASPASS